MPIIAVGKNLMLDQLASRALYLSLHSADPGSGGANEVSGGSPAYAREAVTWDAASSGELTTSGSVTFDVPAGDVAHVGLWSASSGGGTFYGSGALTRETFAAQGTYELTAVTVRLADA